MCTDAHSTQHVCSPLEKLVSSRRPSHRDCPETQGFWISKESPGWTRKGKPIAAPGVAPAIAAAPVNNEAP